MVESNQNPLERNTNSKSKIGELMHFTNESDIRDKRKAMLKTILDNQEKQIILLRFGIPAGNNLTLNQVAKKLDMSVARVRKIEQGALKKLRENSSMQFLKEYL